MATAKEEIRKMLDALADDATWEDLQYSLYVRERVERGRREVDQSGRGRDPNEAGARRIAWNKLGLAGIGMRRELPAEVPEPRLIVPEVADDSVRELFVKSYRLIYEDRPDGIASLAFIHGARALPNLR
jgi:hypothetical protein